MSEKPFAPTLNEDRTAMLLLLQREQDRLEIYM